MEIAAAVGVSQATVSRVLAEFTDSREHAIATLHKGANTLAERILKHANVEESVDVLERIEVLRAKQTGAGTAANFQVFIGMPNQPVGPDPVIDLSPVPRNELTP